MSECLFRVNFVARTSIVVKANTGLEAENVALSRLQIDGDWEVESSDVIAEWPQGKTASPKERIVPKTSYYADPKDGEDQ